MVNALFLSSSDNNLSLVMDSRSIRINTVTTTMSISSCELEVVGGMARSLDWTMVYRVNHVEQLMKRP